LAAGYVALKRQNLESGHRSVAMAVVYDEVANLARMNGISTVEALQMFGDRGVGTVLLKETTVRDAAQNGEFVQKAGSELLLLDENRIVDSLGEDFRRQIKPDYRYLIFSNQAAYERVRGHLAAKGVPLQTREHEGLFVIETGMSWASLEMVGTGFPGWAVDDVQAAGLNVMVQVRTWNQVTAAGLNHVFSDIESIPNLTGLAFNDPVLPGVPSLIRPLAYEIQRLDVPIVQIEFSNQMGLPRLGLMLDKNVLRLHTLTLEEDAKRNFNIASMVDRFALAASERNIRVLLLHTYSKADVPDMLQFNLQLTEKVANRLAAEGLQVGEASVLAPLALSRLVVFIIGLGVIAGGMLLAFVIGWGRAVPFLGLAGLLFWTALLELLPISSWPTLKGTPARAARSPSRGASITLVPATVKLFPPA